MCVSVIIMSTCWTLCPLGQCVKSNCVCVFSESQSCLVCTARRINLPEKNVGMLGVEQFTTKQDLHGKILDCDTRYGISI